MRAHLWHYEALSIRCLFFILTVQSVDGVPGGVVDVEGGDEAGDALFDGACQRPGRALHPHRLVQARAAEAVVASERPTKFGEWMSSLQGLQVA